MSLSSNMKSIQDIMRQDPGVDGDVQRISQLAWIIFLKVFDDKEVEWEFEDAAYKSAIPEKYRWRIWAANKEGLTGNELILHVNEMFRNLRELSASEDCDFKGYIVKEIFKDTYNYMKSGFLLRQVLNCVNEINFNKSNDRTLFNEFYEKMLLDLQSAGNAGEYYTPRAITQFVIEMIRPILGDIILDPACGTGGFLINSIERLKLETRTNADFQALQNNISGIEKKPLPYVLCTTNMLLHGIESPKIEHADALLRPLKDCEPLEKADVIVTNPPFGGIEEPGIETSCFSSFGTRETSDLILLFIMNNLKERGRCGIVLPDGFLFGEGAKTLIKEKLLAEFNLHTIIRLPNGVFSPYTGIKTNLLFFEKGSSTKEVWYFEHPLPDGIKSYSKIKPITFEEFDLERQWWNNRKENKYAWRVDISEIKKRNYNLDFKNPNTPIETDGLTVLEAIKNLEQSVNESCKILKEIKDLAYE